jgi:dynein heavy chain, axonemal
MRHKMETIVCRNTCRALFERHKLLLSFHMVSRILFQSGKLSSHEYLFLLKGGVVLDRSEQPENPTSLPLSLSLSFRLPHI